MISRNATGPRAFVVGWPISHSRSPLLHGHWLKVHGLAGSYERLAVRPEEIDAFLGHLPMSGYAGGNVTVPYKEDAFSLAEEKDEVALATGAVNTLWIESGRLCATNTDAPGFLANLDDRARGWDRDPDVAVVLGAGGASRAVTWGLLRRGFVVRVVNRTLGRAEDLVRRFGSGSSAHRFDELPRLLADASLLVNTTSLGMSGKDDLDIDLSPLPEHAIVTDAVYVPLVTPLLAKARARGLRTVDGLGMLLHQAVDGFEHWFGLRPSVTEDLRALILADIASS